MSFTLLKSRRKYHGGEVIYWEKRNGDVVKLIVKGKGINSKGKPCLIAREEGELPELRYYIPATLKNLDKITALTNEVKAVGGLLNLGQAVANSAT